MSASQAACYVGLSEASFLSRVKTGIYPKAQEIGRRRLWDRCAIDATLDRMGGLSEKEQKGTPNLRAEAIALQRAAERMALRNAKQ